MNKRCYNKFPVFNYSSAVILSIQWIECMCLEIKQCVFIYSRGKINELSGCAADSLAEITRSLCIQSAWYIFVKVDFFSFWVHSGALHIHKSLLSCEVVDLSRLYSSGWTHYISFIRQLCTWVSLRKLVWIAKYFTPKVHCVKTKWKSIFEPQCFCLAHKIAIKTSRLL